MSISEPLPRCAESSSEPKGPIDDRPLRKKNGGLFPLSYTGEPGWDSNPGLPRSTSYVSSRTSQRWEWMKVIGEF